MSGRLTFPGRSRDSVIRRAGEGQGYITPGRALNRGEESHASEREFTSSLSELAAPGPLDESFSVADLTVGHSRQPVVAVQERRATTPPGSQDKVLESVGNLAALLREVDRASLEFPIKIPIREAVNLILRHNGVDTGQAAFVLQPTEGGQELLDVVENLITLPLT